MSGDRRVDQFLDALDPIDATRRTRSYGGRPSTWPSPLYRRKDAGNRLAASYTPGGTDSVDTDPLAKVALLVLAWKARCGCG